MTPSCDEARDWLAMQGTGLAPTAFTVAAKNAAHLASCETCQQTLQRHEDFASRAGTVLRHQTHPDAELQMLTALSAQHRPAPRSFRPLLAVAAMAAVALGIGGFQLLPERLPAIQPVHAATLTAIGSGAHLSPTRTEHTPRRPESNTPPEPVEVADVLPSTRPLRPPTTVATGVDSRHFEGDDIAALTVAARSRLDVDAWSQALSRLTLHQGEVRVDVPHREPGEVFEILTDNARVVVAAAAIRVRYDENFGTRIESKKGRVRVETHTGEPLGSIDGGEHFDVPLAPLSPLRRARRLLATGHPQEAIVILTGLPTRTWEEEALLGDAHRLGNELPEAEQAYRKALSLAPAQESLWVDLATLQAQSSAKRHAETWASYLEAFPHGAQVSRAHLAIAEQALEEGHSSRAIPHLEHVMASADSSEAPQALAHLGAVLLAAKRWDDAERLFVPFLHASDERGETALVGMASVDLARGNSDLAQQRLSTYKDRFKDGLRQKEVAQLEARIRHP